MKQKEYENRELRMKKKNSKSDTKHTSYELQNPSAVFNEDIRQPSPPLLPSFHSFPILNEHVFRECVTDSQ